MNRSGFTLVEVVIVIAVLSILATMALPTMNKTLADRELDNAAQILVGGLRNLQQTSLNTTPSGNFPIMKFDKTAPSRYYVTANLKTVDSATFADTVTISSSPIEITFGMNGLPNAPATIILYSNKTKKLKYVIIASTGRIRTSDQAALDNSEKAQ